MAYDSAIALDQLSQSQAGHATTANGLFKATSTAALFGIKQSATSGLQFTLYGGNMYVADVPTAVATQTVTLTASATNYIYATSAGVVTKTTSIPSGWPGPLAAGAIALYTLVVGVATITSGDNHLIGVSAAGVTGPQGEIGAAGGTFEHRPRVWTANGDGAVTTSFYGWTTFTNSGLTATARSLASSSLRESIPYLAYLTAATAGSGGQVYSAVRFCYRGSAAGRGGFTCSIRFCLESASSPANQRSFFGLFVPATIGNVEPDTLLNVFGIAAKAGEANFSVMHNDGTGAATMTTLGANFPARGTDNVYEFYMTAVANAASIDYTLTNCNTSDVASGSVSSNLPDNTTFLTIGAWINNGSTASAAAFGLMQVVGETPY
jgi:hypothetical protein